MNGVIRNFIALGAILSASAAFGQQKADVEVRVVDAQGKPVPGVRIAQQWQVQGGQVVPAGPPDAVLTTDAQGVARGAQNYFRLPLGFMAIDATGERGAVHIVRAAEELAKPTTLRLEPLRAVPIRVQVREWRHDEAPAVTGNIRPADDMVGLLFFGAGPETTVRLPAGRYALGTFSFDTARAEDHAFQVPAGREPVPPVAVTLEMSPLARAAGQAPPPLTVTEAIGLPKGFRLEDYRGKWVMFEIWGYW
jgi:hypothetical protein